MGNNNAKKKKKNKLHHSSHIRLIRWTLPVSRLLNHHKSQPPNQAQR